MPPPVIYLWLFARKLKKLLKVCHIGDASHRSRLIETVIEKDSKLDILVSNAAVNPYFGSMLDTPEASWDKIFEINVKNAFQLIQESVPHLEKQVITNKLKSRSMSDPTLSEIDFKHKMA